MKQLLKVMLPRQLRDVMRSIAEKLQPIAYIGNKVECPCCGSRWREFLPHGRPERANARCAKCDSLERHRLIYLFLQEYKAKLRGAKVLHFAPEEILAGYLRECASLYVSTDLMRTGVDMLADITRLPYADGTFDAIICVHILEHIPNDSAAMAELRRILRPGGIALLQVPLDPNRQTTYEDWSITDPAERRLHFGQEDHVRWYGMDYYDRLRAAGFRVKLQTYPESIGRRHGLMSEDLVLCS